MHVGVAGAEALAAALDRGALPRLKGLGLGSATFGDAGLAALAPALRRRPALEQLYLCGSPLDDEGSPLGDEGLAALVAPPPPAGTPPPPAGGLKKLEVLDLDGTQVTDAGRANPRRRARQRSVACARAARSSWHPRQRRGEGSCACGTGKVESCSADLRRGVSHVQKSLILQS